MTNTPQHDRQESTVSQLVTFVLGDEEFGVDILKVREIIRPTTFTRLPQAPEFLEGIINLRDQIVPVVDLRRRFAVSAQTRTDDAHTARVIVVELTDQVVGFLVDEVREVIRIDAQVTEAPPELATSVEASYITGVAKLESRILILLDLSRLLTVRERDALQRSTEPVAA